MLTLPVRMILLVLWLGLSIPSSAISERLHVRRPVALAVVAHSPTLWVANRDNGALSAIDPRTGAVQAEFPVGQRLSDMVAVPGTNKLLITEEESQELLVVTCDQLPGQVEARIPVSPCPVGVAVSPDGRYAAVSCLWSHRLDVIDLQNRKRSTSTLLPFAPRKILFFPGAKDLLVADAFAGRLAILRRDDGKLLATHELEGQNVRGLLLSPEGREVWLAHQIVSEQASTNADNLRRGVVMSNVVRCLSVEDLRNPRGEIGRASRLIRLDRPGEGAADPGPLAWHQGFLAVGLTGTGQVAIVDPTQGAVRRVSVGQGPRALASLPDGRLAVANTFDDSVSVFGRTVQTVQTISLGLSGELSYRQRGERLFHDARLALGQGMSCHSCHPDGHTTGRLSDTFTDGSFGTPKRSLTLLGTRMTDPWGWTGSSQYLHDQVEKSLRETMQLAEAPPETIANLTSFLHALPPPPPRDPMTSHPEDHAQVERGRRLFKGRGCVRCHIPPLTYSSHGTQDGGYADEKGRRTFSPPSLRGVSQGIRFLHDGRARSLEEVFTRFDHKGGNELCDEEFQDLMRFLRSL